MSTRKWGLALGLLLAVGLVDAATWNFVPQEIRATDQSQVVAALAGTPLVVWLIKAALVGVMAGLAVLTHRWNDDRPFLWLERFTALGTIFGICYWAQGIIANIPWDLRYL